MEELRNARLEGRSNARAEILRGVMRSKIPPHERDENDTSAASWGGGLSVSSRGYSSVDGIVEPFRLYPYRRRHRFDENLTVTSSESGFSDDAQVLSDQDQGSTNQGHDDASDDDSSDHEEDSSDHGQVEVIEIAEGPDSNEPSVNGDGFEQDHNDSDNEWMDGGDLYHPDRYARVLESSDQLLPGDDRYHYYCWSAIHFATRRGDDNAISILLDAGADIEQASKGFCECELGPRLPQRILAASPLHIAVCSVQTSSVRLLLSLGANAQQTNGHLPPWASAMG
jgi:hypothetical protein